MKREALFLDFAAAEEAAKRRVSARLGRAL